MTFGAVVGDRSPEGRDWYRRYWESSVEVPSEAFDEIAAIAREAATYLVIGVIERDGGTLYCSVLFFAPDGEYLGKHRKLVPTASERLIWGQGDGSTMPVFDTAIGKMGAAICWENYMQHAAVKLATEVPYDTGQSLFADLTVTSIRAMRT